MGSTRGSLPYIQETILDKLGQVKVLLRMCQRQALNAARCSQPSHEAAPDWAATRFVDGTGMRCHFRATRRRKIFCWLYYLPFFPWFTPLHICLCGRGGRRLLRPLPTGQCPAFRAVSVITLSTDPFCNISLPSSILDCSVLTGA
jgi:hypothetical protein